MENICDLLFVFQVTDETSCCLIAANMSTWRSVFCAATWTSWFRHVIAGVRWPRGAWPLYCCPRTHILTPTEQCWTPSRGQSSIYPAEWKADFIFGKKEKQKNHCSGHSHDSLIDFKLLLRFFLMAGWSCWRSKPAWTVSWCMTWIWLSPCRK